MEERRRRSSASRAPLTITGSLEVPEQLMRWERELLERPLEALLSAKVIPGAPPMEVRDGDSK